MQRVVIKKNKFSRKENFMYINSQCLILLYSLFAFTRGSIGLAIPAKIWFLEMFFILSICFLTFFQNRIMRVTKEVAFVLYVLLVVVLYRNQDFVRGVYADAFFLIVVLVVFLVLRNSDKWHNMFLKILIIVGVFYSFWTIICAINEDIYYNFILPWLRVYSPQTSRGDYMCGFTTHYSTNGIYLALGTMATLSILMTRYKKKQNTKFYWFLLAFIGSGLLFSGKRGITISVIIGFCAAYLFMTKKRGRMFKLVFLLAIVSIILFIASFWIEPILSIILRFSAQLESGDVSTGRFELWRQAWNAFVDNPIFGNGWGWFRYNNTFGLEFHVHNCYLQWMLELGVIFAIPMLFFVVYSYYRIFKLYRILSNMNLSNEKLNGNVAQTAITFAFIYETFFLLFAFEGTAFYEVPTYFVYFLSVAVAEYYSRFKLANE